MLKLNNKGFTLIEILAVVVILGVLSTIMIPSVTSIIKKNRVENQENFKNSLISAAKAYITDNKYKIEFSTSNCSSGYKCINKIDNTAIADNKITLKILVDNGYLNENLKEPSTKKEIDLTSSYVTVKYNINQKDFDYSTPTIITSQN